MIRKKDHVRAFRDINDENIAYFQWALQNENWEAVYDQENVNTKFNTFHNTFLTIVENSFPLVYKKKRKTPING